VVSQGTGQRSYGLPKINITLAKGRGTHNIAEYCPGCQFPGSTERFETQRSLSLEDPNRSFVKQKVDSSASWIYDIIDLNTDMPRSLCGFDG
jgi:hypothetical protein